jgi:hypothetical protein
MIDYNKIKCVILDLDKTIIGDLTDISSYDTLICAFDWKNQLFDKFTKIDESFIENKLQNGLLRPGIIDFINYIYKIRKISIVIYTLSERHWASKIINMIIKIIGYNFITLLLCREDCLSINKKSIIHVIQKLNNINISIEIENIVMYDDNPTVKMCLILVPKYNFKPHFNFIKELKPNLIKSSLEKHDYQQFILSLKTWKYDTLPFHNESDNDYEIVNRSEFLSKDDFFIYEIKKYILS